MEWWSIYHRDPVNSGKGKSNLHKNTPLPTPFLQIFAPDPFIGLNHHNSTSLLLDLLTKSYLSRLNL
uniref:Uncharacterized protein n=1 Tax=Rhizophora mucronata TaxID=61149 RepID=A0A2P2NQR0_RHIMU